MLTIKGYFLNVLGKNIVVKQKPTHKVLRYLSDDEFSKQVQIKGSYWTVRESLTLMSGEKIVINYLKNTKS